MPLRFIILLLLVSLSPCLRVFSQTEAVIKTKSTNALTESIVVPTGKSITINSGASIINNGTATGFGSGGTWGSITGTLSSQTDLATALGLKAPLASPTFTGTVSLPATSATSIGINGSLTSGSNTSLAESGGTLFVGSSSTNGGQIALVEGSAAGNSNWVGLKSPASVAADCIFTLPGADGSSGQALVTNGSKVLSFATISSGITIGTTTITSGTSGRWLYNNAGVVDEQALGTGVATFLGTPTIANLNSAVSDADLATLGANTFTAAQTIDGSADAIQLLIQGHSTQTSSPLVVEQSGGTNVFEVTNDGRIEGVANPGFPQFTANNKTNSGMRVYSDRVDLWENGSVLMTLQGGVITATTIAFTGGYITMGLSGGSTGPIIRAGAGSPEGSITAPIGSIYTNSTNGDLYRKTSGTGNTGWVTP